MFGLAEKRARPGMAQVQSQCRGVLPRSAPALTLGGEMPWCHASAERFWAHVDVRGKDECWPWLGASTGNGYGQTKEPGRPAPVLAHRVAYALSVGPIPEGLHLDHVRARGCVMRSCCNPDHLEPVTPSENSRRGENAQRNKTHCKHGHVFDEANTYLRPDGNGRQCRACIRGRNGRPK